MGGGVRFGGFIALEGGGEAMAEARRRSSEAAY
jgi:hypothetical protein